MKQYQRYQPNISGVLNWVDSAFSTPEGFSSGRWFQMMWPWMFATAFLGITIELLKFVILETRRNIYNRNRNLKYSPEARRLKYTEKIKRTRKNQLWRKKSRKSTYHPIRPLPPSFAEHLNKQWDKAHDSLEEMLKFGAMLIELDDYVDNSFKFRGDVIVGRCSGMKGFLNEFCPQIGYKTAMRYRMLALKALEIEKENLQEIHKKCEDIYELTERFDTWLKVEHIPLGHKRHRHQQFTPPEIVAIRKKTHSDIKRLHPIERKRYFSAFKKLAREISVV